MTMPCPTCAQRTARPAPSLPVPPRIAMFRRGLLTEEVAGRIAWPRLGAVLAGRQRQPAHDRGGDAVELAHHGLGGGGQLVGDGEDRRLQRPPGRIALAEIAAQRCKAGDPDGDVDEALAPGPAERVGHDHVHLGPRLGAHGVAERAGRAIGVLGQQRDRVGVGVRLVHAGVGADPAVMRLGHQHTAIHSHDAARLAEDHLDQPRIAAELSGERRCHRGRRDLGESQQSPLRLGDDLLADDQHVTGRDRRALLRGGGDDQPRDVVARPHLADPLDADDLVARRPAQPSTAGRTPASRSGSRQRTSSSRLWVPAPSPSSASRSSGASTSRLSPRRRMTLGVSRSARAAVRWFSKEGSPKRSRIAFGGASSTPLVPRPEREGTNTTAGGPVSAATRARISAPVTHGTSPGIVRNARAPTRAASAWAVATAAVWPRFSASASGSAPRPRAIVATSGSRVTTQTRSTPAPPKARRTSTSIARASSRRSGPSSTRMSRCLALVTSFTGTAATILPAGPCPYARSLPPRRR